MTLQPSEPDFMLERKEGSVVIENLIKKKRKAKKKKGTFHRQGLSPAGVHRVSRELRQPVSSPGRPPEEHSCERKDA